MRLVWGIDSHLGDRVSALVDGQLSPDEEDRAWTHVVGCAGCRRLVERERWLKSRLSAIAVVPDQAPAPRPGLLGALYDVDAWAAVDELERDSLRHRAMIAAVGAGTVGAAVLGIVMLTGAPAGLGERPARQLPTQIGTGLPGPVGSPGANQATVATRHRAR